MYQWMVQQVFSVLKSKCFYLIIIMLMINLNFTDDFILVGADIRCKILNHVCQIAEPIIVSKNQIKVQDAS